MVSLTFEIDIILEREDGSLDNKLDGVIIEHFQILERP